MAKHSRSKVSPKGPPLPAEIAAAILSSHGVLSVAATKLGYSRRWIAMQVAESEELQRVVEEAREALVDQAEHSLAELTTADHRDHRDHFNAIKYTLDHRGRERGWGNQVQRIEVSGSPLEAAASLLGLNLKGRSEDE